MWVRPAIYVLAHGAKPSIGKMTKQELMLAQARMGSVQVVGDGQLLGMF